MPDPKPNTVAHCNQRIDDLIQYEQQLEHRIEALEAPKDTAQEPAPKLAVPGQWSGTPATDTWSAPRTSSEDAQKKAVESARQVTKSCLLAAIRDELNADHTSTLRVRNLSQAYADLYGEAS